MHIDFGNLRSVNGLTPAGKMLAGEVVAILNLVKEKTSCRSFGQRNVEDLADVME